MAGRPQGSATPSDIPKVPQLPSLEAEHQHHRNDTTDTYKYDTGICVSQTSFRLVLKAVLIKSQFKRLWTLKTNVRMLF